MEDQELEQEPCRCCEGKCCSDPGCCCQAHTCGQYNWTSAELDAYYRSRED